MRMELFMAIEVVYDSQVTNLTISRARQLAPKEFGPAYNWFIENTGRHISALPHRMKADKPNLEIPLSRDSGIYIPGKRCVQFREGRRYALSIHTGKGYNDKPLLSLADKTWILDYSEHRGNAGEQGYNDSLINCLNDGIPVGVFLKDRSGGYTVLGLAYVERYNGFTGMFTLHGPITPATEQAGCFIYRGFDELPDSDRDLLSSVEDPSDERKTAIALQVRREQQGKFRQLILDAYDQTCAITQTNVPQVLQAAHINPYRGKRSQIVSNGLLPRADLHLLFDAFLLSVDPKNGAVVLSKKLVNSKYTSLKGRELRLPSDHHNDPSPALLALHHDQFLIENQIIGVL